MASMPEADERDAAAMSVLRVPETVIPVPSKDHSS
jgi:hypothetical protein